MGIFAQKLKGYEGVLKLISTVPTGRKALHLFYPLLSSGQVQILSYPPDLRKKLTEGEPSLKPLGAAFVTDGNEGSIYYDDQGELGVLAVLIFHEMIHSLDETLWLAGRFELPTHQRNEIIFQSECKAYSEQYSFQKELKEAYPQLIDYFISRAENFPSLNRQVEPHEIAELHKGQGR